MSTVREDSKREWNSKEDVEHIQLGCLQRIADATEKMAANYTRMQDELNRYKRYYEKNRGQIAQLERQITAQKSASSRYRNQRDEARNTIENLKKQIKDLSAL